MKTMLKAVSICMICAACSMPEPARAENLCINGEFNVVTNGNKPYGWIYDLSFADRTPWKNNPRYVTVKEKEGSRKNVLALEMGNIGARDEAVVISNIIPFDQTKKYKIAFDGRTEGPMERIYIRGYKWKSGIKPHENPEFSELQDIYHGKPFEALGRSWKRVTREFPYYSKTDSSELNLSHLKSIRFIVLYVIIPLFETNPPGSVYLDNVEITVR